MALATTRPLPATRAFDPVRHALAWGVALPILYFGIQAAAAPFYPGYSFLSQDASTLGSAASWIFNVGALLVGAVHAAVAGAFLSALPRAGVGRTLAALTALALASAGVGSLNAFLHPLPDPLHTEGTLAALGSGVVLLPLLTTAVLWRLGARRAAAAVVVCYVALIPLMTGLVQRACIGAGLECGGFQYFLNHYHGLVQRLGAAAVFVPVAVVAHYARTPNRR
jgi:hypothetical protein